MKRWIILMTVIFLSACNLHRGRELDTKLNQADTLLVQEKYEESFVIYKGIYEEDSSNLKATYGYGLANLKLGNNVQAKYYFNKYLNKKQDASAFLYRGVVYDNLDSVQQAINDYSMAISIDSNRAEAYNNRGRLKISLKQYDEGIKDIDSALKIDSNQPACYDNIGLAYDNQGQYKEAIKYYEKAISGDLNNGIYYFNKGAAYIHLGQNEKAIEDLNKAIELMPTNGLFYKNRAIAYYNLKELNKTCEDLHKAVQFNDVSSKEYLDKICSQEGKVQKAI